MTDAPGMNPCPFCAGKAEMSNLGKAAQPRRFYHHVLNGGTLTPENVSLMVQTIEELEAENARNNASIDALKLGLNELAAIAKERADRIEELEAENALIKDREKHRNDERIEALNSSARQAQKIARLEAENARMVVEKNRAIADSLEADMMREKEKRRAEAAEAKLATARNDALEDAAKACDDEVDRVEDAIKWGGAKPYIKRCEAAAYAMRDRSAAIRAMKSTSQT